MRLIVAAKKIPNEEINIHLKQKPEWFVSKINPFGQVPVIEHEGHLIRESTVAFGRSCEHLHYCVVWYIHTVVLRLVATSFILLSV